MKQPPLPELLLDVEDDSTLEIVNEALAVPPPGVALTTLTVAVPEEAISSARMAAVSCVNETYVVARLDPFHCTVDPLMKLLPLTVRVNAAPPAVVEDGLRNVMAGAGLMTLVLRAWLLLVMTVPDDDVVTADTLLMVPVTVGRRTRVRVADVPLLMLPKLQVMGLAPLHVPWLGVVETRVYVPVRVVVRTVEETADEPVLKIVVVWVI